MTDKKYVDPDYNPMMRPGLDDSEKISPDCSGLNFFSIDHQFQSLLPLYADENEYAHFKPHLNRLGEV
ncbi:MAG: hypothetical protein HN701_14360, partial [Rhodospirillaceae bacterium]|nr:hypothetical protein [Rhodospirillaceae bacterium]